MLSELERDVLEAVILGKRKVDEIAEFCGIPEFTVNEIVRRLLERGYLTEELTPTEKAYGELKWVDSRRSPTVYGENIRRFFKLILDLIIIFILLYLIRGAIT